MYRLAVIQKISSKGKYVVSVSKYLEEILNEGGIRVNKVINNSIDLKKFEPNHEKNLVGECIFVGSYNYAKGFDELQELASRGIDITCVTNKKLAEPLKYIDNVNHDLMNEIYNKYKILVFPSSFESFGYVPLEAMSCGLPIIMYDVGIGKDIVNFEKDFIIQLDSSNVVDQYYERIKRINENYNEYSKTARKIAESKFGFEIFKMNWISLLEDIYANNL